MIRLGFIKKEETFPEFKKIRRIGGGLFTLTQESLNFKKAEFAKVFLKKNKKLIK